MMLYFWQQVVYQDPSWYRLNVLMDPSLQTWRIAVPCRAQAVKVGGRVAIRDFGQSSGSDLGLFPGCISLDNEDPKLCLGNIYQFLCHKRNLWLEHHTIFQSGDS